MYDKYVKPRKEDEWTTNCYGDIPNLIPRTTVESVFVLSARKRANVQRGVLCALIVMIPVFLGITVRLLTMKIWRNSVKTS